MRWLPTEPAETLGWARPDLLRRLLPFTAAGVAGAAWLGPARLGLAAGDPGVQLGFGAAGAVLLFAGAAAVQRALSARRGSLRVPATTGDLLLQVCFYALNAPVEELFFRGLVQGGLGAFAPGAVAFAVATTLYVLYHRLGGWGWPEVAATALVGVPLGLAFALLPGGTSLLGVSVAHFGATCGFLGPGPYLLRRLRLL